MPQLTAAGLEEFVERTANPNAEVHFYDTGHFALETHHAEIAATILDFLGRKLGRKAKSA